MASIPTVDSTFVIAAVTVVLFLFTTLLAINFLNHFLFHYKCPYIVRDSEVDGIYPTLILIYIFISSLVLILTLYTPPPSHFDNLCSDKWTMTDMNAMNPRLFDHSTLSLSHVLIPFLLALQFVVETYFSLSRYYNIRAVTHTDCGTNIRFTVYSISFLISWWCSLTMAPFLIPLISIFHVASTGYYSYSFYRLIRQS